MPIRLVTVVFDPATGRFPENPLAGLPSEPVSVVEHFFFHANLPHLLLVAHLRDDAPDRRAAPDRPDPRAELTEDERRVYDRIRAWRQARVAADSMPAYTFLNNRQAAEVARRRPTTLTALKEISGIGEAKAAKFGQELLAVVAGDGA